MSKENVFENEAVEETTADYSANEAQAIADEASADVEFPESRELKDRVLMLEVARHDLATQVEELSEKFTSLRNDVAAAMKQMGFSFDKLANMPISRKQV